MSYQIECFYSLRVEEETKFVTIAFGVEDDLKGSAKKDSIKVGYTFGSCMVEN